MSNKNKILSFPERIKSIIELAGSAEKLAHSAGMSARVIGQYLSRKSDPTRKKLIALANAVDVNIEWLATGKGVMLVRDHEKINIELLNFLFDTYENYEKKLGSKLSHIEKAWAIGTIFNFYSTRDFKDETVKNTLLQDIENLHNLFELYKKLINSDIKKEMIGDVLKGLFKQEWYKEEAEIIADELIRVGINSKSSNS